MKNKIHKIASAFFGICLVPILMSSYLRDMGFKHMPLEFLGWGLVCSLVVVACTLDWAPDAMDAY